MTYHQTARRRILRAALAWCLAAPVVWYGGLMIGRYAAGGF